MCGRRKHIVDTGIIENDIGTNMRLNKYKFKLKFISKSYVGVKQSRSKCKRIFKKGYNSLKKWSDQIIIMIYESANGNKQPCKF